MRDSCRSAWDLVLVLVFFLLLKQNCIESVKCRVKTGAFDFHSKLLRCRAWSRPTAFSLRVPAPSERACCKQASMTATCTVRWWGEIASRDEFGWDPIKECTYHAPILGWKDWDVLNFLMQFRSQGDPYALQHRRAKDTCPEASQDRRMWVSIGVKDLNEFHWMS